MQLAKLSQMAFGYANSQVLYATVRLGVADALADGPLPAAELARQTGCAPAELARLLRALILLGVVDAEEASDVAAAERVALTELGRPLCAGHPQSLQSGILLQGDPAMWRAWGDLTQGLRGGASAFACAHGQPLFDYIGGDPRLAAVFHATMRAGAEALAAGVVKAYNFGSARTVADIGGGHGRLLAAVLEAAPAARGILLDTAAGVAEASRTLHNAGMSGRCSVEVSDFFQGVPEGDVMLLNGILHDWDDERSAVLLRHCRDSIAADGHLLVLEQVRPEQLAGAEAATAVMSDLAMLVYAGGRERSAQEFRRLLAGAGFSLAGITPPLTPSFTRMLIAQPA